MTMRVMRVRRRCNGNETSLSTFVLKALAYQQPVRMSIRLCELRAVMFHTPELAPRLLLLLG